MGPDAMIFVFWMLSFKPTFSLSSFTFIKRLFSSCSLYAIRVVSSAYLRLLIFLPTILIPACASSSPAFLMMYSAYKLNNQDIILESAISNLMPSWRYSVFPSRYSSYQASQVALVVKDLPANAGGVWDMGLIPGSGRSLGENMAPHTSVVAWRSPWTEEPGRLQSIGLHRVVTWFWLNIITLSAIDISCDMRSRIQCVVHLYWKWSFFCLMIFRFRFMNFLFWSGEGFCQY